MFCREIDSDNHAPCFPLDGVWTNLQIRFNSLEICCACKKQAQFVENICFFARKNWTDKPYTQNISIKI